MSDLLFTGFPGFIGVMLLPRILLQRPSSTVAHCLVQMKYINYAKKKLQQIETEHPTLKGRIQLHTGDITRQDLGLGDTAGLCKSVGEVFHLAAAQDVGVGKDWARKVNVDGTRNLLTIAGSCSSLKRFHYLSTLFVSGRKQGFFRERDLEVGQKFFNSWEETKFEAEVAVAQAQGEGLPVTIYRIPFVVGDSDTGETQKYDGPYYLLRWILALPKVFFFPSLGGGLRYRFNLIPRDFLVNAIVWLSGQKTSLNRTYHLTDPHPVPVLKLFLDFGKAAGKILIPFPVPKELVKFGLTHFQFMKRWMQVPPQLFDYLQHPARYSVENMMVDLKGSGVHCPQMSGYQQTLVDFVMAHGEITSRPMM